MTIGLVFWILMLLWLILGVYWNWPAGGPQGPNYPVWGGNILLFILLLLLGWGVFGPPIRG